MSITPERKMIIGNNEVVEIYFGRRYVVYLNNQLIENETFDQVVARLRHVG